MARRNFEFIKDGKEHVFSGNTPRDAALKAATRFGTKGRPKTKIELRERGRKNKDGTYSLHTYVIGYRETPTRKDAPSWLGKSAKEGVAKKVGVKHVQQKRRDTGSTGPRLTQEENRNDT